MALLLLPLLKKGRGIYLLILHTAVVFFYQGAQMSKTLRYFYTIYPALAIITSYSLLGIVEKFRLKIGYIPYLLIPILLIWPVSYFSIFTRTNTRVAASEWIYRNAAPGSVIAGESWDDYLPLSLDKTRLSGNYKIVSVPITGPDTDQKWEEINRVLLESDYIILSSNRAYGSIMTIPDMYPRTSKYYYDLFAGNLGFSKVTEFTSRPNLPFPGVKICLKVPFQKYGIISDDPSYCPLTGISFVDDYAEELWTVYEHPKVIIFKKNLNSHINDI
jgi:hypothetical protein